MQRSLKGRVCLVAGASRGVGRGIARGLGEAGATVICTARSSEPVARTDGRPETIEDTARLVEVAGGIGHHYVCDHTGEAEVDRLVSWTLRRFDRIDGLFGAVWGGEEGSDGERLPDGSRFGTPLWRRPPARLGDLLQAGLYAQLLTVKAVAPAMVAAKRGLVALGVFDDGGAYLGDPFYDIAQNAIARLAFVAAEELRPHGVTALALSPGFVRTERVVDAGRGAEATETPLYAGRAAAALLADPEVARHAGRIVHVADLAEAHGFTDEDGLRPRRYRLPREA